MRHYSTNDILLVDGLSGYDDHLDYLTRLFEEQQLCCVEAASFNDVLDLIGNALWFGLIIRQEPMPDPPLEDAILTSDEDIKPSAVHLGAEAVVVVAPRKPKKSRRRKNKKHQALKDQPAGEGGIKVNQSERKTSDSFSGSTETLVAPSLKSSVRHGGNTWWDHTDGSNTKPSRSISSADIPFNLGSSKQIKEECSEQTSNWTLNHNLTAEHEHLNDIPGFKITPLSSFQQNEFLSPLSSPSPNRSLELGWNPTAAPQVPKEPLGFIYLFSTPHHESLNAVGEVRIGLILHEKYRGYGYAQQAVQLVVEYAFDELKCHRIQATLLQTPLKAHALKLFTRERFSHEGTRRSTFFSPLEREWKDATSMAMIDTEWVIRSSLVEAPPTLWDEMFLRHERERDTLLRWEQNSKEEERRLLKKTSSMETVRYDTGSYSNEAKGKRKAVDLEDFVDDQEYLAAAGDVDLALDVEEEEEEEDLDTKRPKLGGAYDSTSTFGSSTAFALGGLEQALASPPMPSRLSFGQDHDGDGSSSESSWDAIDTSSISSFDSLSDVS
ncbi:hypothetical protein DFS33DRAFT_1384366 [Desarmillaria ectypa]|nr:hypothetical protein DFS33DRAFT_1384366 [Desarmillaria ectypa]